MCQGTFLDLITSKTMNYDFVVCGLRSRKVEHGANYVFPYLLQTTIKYHMHFIERLQRCAYVHS